MTNKVFSIFILFVLIFSCKDSNYLAPESNLNEIHQTVNVNEAKSHYDKIKAGLRQTKSDERIVFWNDSKSIVDEKGIELLSVPFVDKGNSGVMVEDSRITKPEKLDVFTGDVKTNLIFRKENGNIVGRIVHYIRNEETYVERKMKLVAPLDFDGYAVVYNLDDTYESTILFKNGKETHSSLTNKRARPNSYITICITYYSQACVGGYCGPVQAQTICESVYVSGSGTSGQSFSSSGISGSSGGAISSFSSFQNIAGYWPWFISLNQTEKDYYLNKPHLIIPSIANRTLAQDFTQLYYCTQNDDINGNAFKHVVWSALNALTMGRHNAIDIAENHETDQGNGIRPTMDRHNNDLGVATYLEISWYIGSMSTAQQTAEVVNKSLIKIANGEGVRINNNSLIPTNSSERCN